MPDKCTNYMTIVCMNEDVSGDLQKLIVNELQYNKEGSYFFDDNIQIHKQGKRGICFELYSQYTPNYEWLESLLHKYPNCWIKNEWSSENGFTGVFIGFIDTNKKMVIKHMSWDDFSIDEQNYLFAEQ